MLISDTERCQVEIDAADLAGDPPQQRRNRIRKCITVREAGQGVNGGRH